MARKEDSNGLGGKYFEGEDIKGSEAEIVEW